MQFTCHILAGAAISKTGLNPEVVLPLSFVSHYALDALPHTDLGVFITEDEDGNFRPKNITEWFFLFADVLIGLMLFGIVFFKSSNPYLILSAFLATLPDLLDNVPFWYKLKRYPVFKQLHAVHEFVHFSIPKEKWYLGLISQIIVVGVCLWTLF